MNYKFITYILTLVAFLSACTSDDDVITTPVFPSDENWTEEIIDGASATVKRFEPGDEASRSSIYYDGQGLVFGWEAGDKLGIYPTAKDLSSVTNSTSKDMLFTSRADDTQEGASSDVSSSESGEGESIATQGLLPQDTYPHPSYPQNPNIYRVDPRFSNESPFECEKTTTQTVRIINGSGDFEWDEIVRWSAYFPQSAPQSECENYETRYFSFENQKQVSLPEVGEYFDYEDATSQADKDSHLSKYHLSEAKACSHLGNFDVMISPEMTWSGTRINFQMRHVGAIARIYLKAIEEGFVIKDVKLICDKAIFHEKGSFTLFSHPYKDSEAANYGVDLDRSSDGCQIKPVDEAKKMIQLDFANTCVTKKSGNGWGPYVVAYFMMYPITYNPATDGNLFAYVTAYREGDDPSKEVHFVSEPLSKKTMKSGYYYQWTTAAHPDDGLYPIEMTATLLPWQDIVASEINTDIEK